VLFSAFNALTLSPALAAMLLRPKKKSRGPLTILFGWFNRTFGVATNGYVSTSSLLIRRSAFSMIFLLLVAAGAYFLNGKVPSSFLPEEDQGYLYAGIQLPDAASLQRTDEASRNVEAILARTPGVAGFTTINGFSLLSGVSNTYSAFFFDSSEEFVGQSWLGQLGK
jgi:hydrophobic/amphiphilic exporter-1 (mainly G- bacteria), HAE1 family